MLTAMHPQKVGLKNTNAGYHGASIFGKLINQQGFNIPMIIFFFIVKNCMNFGKSFMSLNLIFTDVDGKNIIFFGQN